VENFIKSYIILSDFHIDYCVIHQSYNKYQSFNLLIFIYLTLILMKFDKKIAKIIIYY